MIFSIDLKPIQPLLFDLPHRALTGMRTEQDGWLAARLEIVDNQPTYGSRAGITATDFKRFVLLDQQHSDIKAQLPAVEKALEVMNESISYLDNQRHRISTQIANAAEAHAELEGGEATLLTAYEKTIAYRAVIAGKSVKTRKKNEAAKKLGDTALGADPVVSASNGASSGPTAGEPEDTGDTGETGETGETVSRMPKPAPDGIFTLDLTPFKAFLVDLLPGATRGMRTEQDGWLAVQQEIIDNQPTYGDRAGVTQVDFDRFVLLNDQYEQLVAYLPLVEKTVEVLTESLAYADHLRHKYVTMFSKSVEERARAEGGASTLLTAYEKTVTYRGVIADKAVKTRFKNEAARKAASTAKVGSAAPTAGTSAGSSSATAG